MNRSLPSLLIFLSCALPAQDLQTLYQQGLEAEKTGDAATFLRRFQSLDSLSPQHPTITYKLAAAYASNGQAELATTYLTRALLMNASWEPEKDSAFANIGLAKILHFKDDLQTETRSGSIAFTHPDVELHPESVAFDPASGHFFLNSVRLGKILRYDPVANTFSDFSTGHWAVMGMRVQGEHLWACEVATNEHIGFQQENEGKSALLQFDLNTGKLLNRYEITGGHWLGDVAFDESGNVYTSDSRAPVVYVVRNDRLEVYKDFSDQLYNLQGIAFHKNSHLMYLADYKTGVHVLDRQTGNLAPLTHPSNLITKGTDGLYFYENSLIAIQNGVSPFRVSRWYLSEDGRQIVSGRILEKAHAGLNEPTLGVIVGEYFYFVGNSPWGAYQKGVFISDGLPENRILKIRMK